MESTVKRTTHRQFEVLIKLMEQNPDLAKGMGNFGSTKKNRNELWEGIALELNNIGPPTRNGREWNKVWLDYKLKLKKKLAANRRETVATGGGPYSQRSLTPLEQTVDELLSLQQAVNPTGAAFGPNLFDQEDEAQVGQTLDDHTQDDQAQDNPTPQNLDVTRTPCRRRRTTAIEERENMRMKALEKQAEVQDRLLKTMEKIERKIDDLSRYARKTYELEKEKIKLLKLKEERKKQENLNKNRRHKENVEIKLKELELKKLKYQK